jgi:hypothetical protein
LHTRTSRKGLIDYYKRPCNLHHKRTIFASVSRAYQGDSNHITPFTTINVHRAHLRLWSSYHPLFASDLKSGRLLADTANLTYLKMTHMYLEMTHMLVVLVRTMVIPSVLQPFERKLWTKAI